MGDCLENPFYVRHCEISAYLDEMCPRLDVAVRNIEGCSDSDLAELWIGATEANSRMVEM